MALVLVVEDELSIAKLLEDVLTDEGYRVVIAGNGRQALEVAARQTPSIVITDFMMPVMDGAALLRHWTADAVLRKVPVIIMSSLPEATVVQRCSGYVAFVRKPFRILEIVDSVAQHVRPTAAGG